MLFFSVLDNESGGQAERPYPPTQHRLARLRGTAAGPHSPGLRAAVAVAVIGGLAAVGFCSGLGLLRQMLSYCCATPDADGLQVAARGLGWGIAGALGLLWAGALVVWLVDGMVAGFGIGRIGRRSTGGSEARIWTMGRQMACAAAAAVLAILAWLLLAGRVTSMAEASRVLPLAGVLAVVVAGVAGAVDVLLAHLQFFSMARMSRAQLIEELRETRGPLVWRARREQFLQGRQRRR